MCGRTASTLSPSAIVKACTYNPAAAGGRDISQAATEGEEKQSQGDSGVEDGSDIASTLVPVWTEAPCGGKYFPSTNIPPTSYTPILYKSSDQLVLQPMMWGLVPHWQAGQPGPKVSWPDPVTTNICRLENVMTSKLYSPSLAKKRCVVVCEGFYEWDRSGGVKQPYLVYRAGGKVVYMYMAGLYSVWRGGNGAPVYNYTIITRESKILSWLHHRMTAFLSPHQISDWLTQALDMLALPREGELAWHTVSREVGNVRNQGMDLMLKVEPSVDNVKKKSEVKVSTASKGLMSDWLKRS